MPLFELKSLSKEFDSLLPFGLTNFNSGNFTKH